MSLFGYYYNAANVDHLNLVSSPQGKTPYAPISPDVSMDAQSDFIKDDMGLGCL